MTNESPRRTPRSTARRRPRPRKATPKTPLKIHDPDPATPHLDALLRMGVEEMLEAARRQIFPENEGESGDETRSA